MKHTRKSLRSPEAIAALRAEAARLRAAGDFLAADYYERQAAVREREANCAPLAAAEVR